MIGPVSECKTQFSAATFTARMERSFISCSITRHNGLALLVCFCWLVLLPLFAAATRADQPAEKSAPRLRPNIVIILADDLGYADVSCYGGKIVTPEIDRLAAGGMRFRDAHSSSAVCTPTRYSLITGRYNWRTKLQSGVLGGLSPHLIAPDRMTIASLLQQHGYHTGCIGKWHLGMDWAIKPGETVTELGIEKREQAFAVDFTQPIKNGPNQVGFHEFYGISASLDMVPYTYIHNDRVAVLPTEDRDFLMMHDRNPQRRTRKGPTAPEFEAEEVLPTIARKSVAFIEQQAARSRAGEPFFLYVPLASPHTPILPTPAWQGKSGINPYADFVMESDWAVGQIAAVLEREKLTENTLFIFTSDNGCSPQALFSELAEHGHHPSGPWRGHKADLFEGGHRVPFIAAWPGQVAAGTVSDQPVCQVDLLATCADIVGAAVPDNAAEDSFSFWPTLQQGTASPRDHLIAHSINGSFSLCQGPWKLLACPDSGGWSQPRPNSPQAKNLTGVQLYHLQDDPGEQQNLAAEHPEIVERLTARLVQLVENGRSTPGPTQANDVPVDPLAQSRR